MGTGAAKESAVIAKAITRVRKRIAGNNWLLRLLQTVTESVENWYGGNVLRVCGAVGIRPLLCYICSRPESRCRIMGAALIYLRFDFLLLIRGCAVPGSVAQVAQWLERWVEPRSRFLQPTPSFAFPFCFSYPSSDLRCSGCRHSPNLKDNRPYGCSGRLRHRVHVCNSIIYQQR